MVNQTKPRNSISEKEGEEHRTVFLLLNYPFISPCILHYFIPFPHKTLLVIILPTPSGPCAQCKSTLLPTLQNAPNLSRESVHCGLMRLYKVVMSGRD